MKAVVMEVRSGKAVVLDHDGTFRMVEDGGFTIGQVLDIEADPQVQKGKREVGDFHPGRLRPRLLPAAAAAALVFLAAGGGVAANVVPISAVTVELDSTFVYHLNLMDRVLSVEASDDSDDTLATELASYVKGKPLENAMEITLDRMVVQKAEQRADETADTPMNVTVESRFGKNSALEQRVSHAVETWNENRPSSASASVTVSFGPRQARDMKPAENAETMPEGAEAGKADAPVGMESGTADDSAPGAVGDAGRADSSSPEPKNAAEKQADAAENAGNIKDQREGLPEEAANADKEPGGAVRESENAGIESHRMQEGTNQDFQENAPENRQDSEAGKNQTESAPAFQDPGQQETAVSGGKGRQDEAAFAQGNGDRAQGSFGGPPQGTGR